MALSQLTSLVFPVAVDSILLNLVAMNMPSGQNDPNVTPCIRNCCLDQQDICLGCFRHLDEILAWRVMSEVERQACFIRMEERKGEYLAKFNDAVSRR